MRRLLSILVLICASASISLAQSPEMFNYQAVLRDASGNIMANQTVDVRIGLYDGGTMDYEETHNVTTDQYGLISLEVGNGTATSGTFSNLDWANVPYEIEVEVDDGSGYVSLGQQALNSVPYALHAESVPSLQLDELDDVNASSPATDDVLQWTGSDWAAQTLGTPSLNMDDLGDVNAGSPASNEVLKWNGSAWTPQADNAGGGSVWNTSGNDIDYSAGAVGIGTTSPGEMLEVDGNVQFGDTISFGSAEMFTDAGANEIGVNSALEPISGSALEIVGNLHVEDSLVELNDLELYRTGTFQLTIDGGIQPEWDNFDDLGSSSQRWTDIYASNGTIQTSDRRDKTNIRDLDYGLEELMSLKPVRYNWKERPEEGDKLGLIAQDLQKVIDEVVKTHDLKRMEDGSVKKVENERLGVYYSDLIPVLIKSIQEQQKEIEELKSQNEELKQLKNEVQALKQQIENLK